MKEDKYRSHCPINFSQEVFGDKWSLLIIRDIMLKGKKYYGEFLEADEKISTNILADRLRRLEKNELITKSVDKKNHSKNIYALTKKGVDLMPLLLEMIVWGAKYDNKTQAPPEFIARFETDKSALIRDLLANLGIDT